ncbi:MAG: carboxypeptidase-like regulatory domain-containing protein [Planctomycetota bacterium]
MSRRLHLMWWVLCLAGLVTAPGCSTYVIKGTVISGGVSDMVFVPQGDARLREPPVASARITVQRNPDKLSRTMAGTDLSDAYGRFVVSLDEFGAGWMDEKWLIQATKPGFKTATARPRLEPHTKKMRLLVILAPGLSTPAAGDEDLMEEYRQHR